MTKFENTSITDFITIDTFNDTSLFAISVIDLENFEVVYINQSMKNIMADLTAKNCWEAIYGQSSPCMWCKAHILQNKLKQDIHPSQSTIDDLCVTYENFNEVVDKWYQVQEKVIKLENNKEVLISFSIDISEQKEEHSQLINTHVKLRQQTKALEDAQEKLKEQINRDPMTALYNRRYFQYMAKELITQTKQKETTLSVILLDIDNFKLINDTYGHGIGDMVIKSLALSIESYIGQDNIVARFGGEEFAILLPNTDINKAVKIAEELRVLIEELPIKIDDMTNIKFTISLGVDAVDNKNDINMDKALNRADKALYKAKENGKNKVYTLN